MKKQFVLMLAIALGVFSCKTNTADETAKHKPVDSLATKETVKLYNDLYAFVDKSEILLGHQDALAYGHTWYKEDGRSDVKDIAGDYPAVVGWELGKLEIGKEFNLDSVYFADMKKYIKDTYRRGGITTCSWHGDNIVTGKTAWDCAQDSVVRTILPNGSNHAKFLTWLDRVGDFFLDLKDDNGNLIPVVFRMYHEHTGNWFWWGSTQCTPAEYKELWIMTFNYLKDTKNVHNLLYSYCPGGVKDEAEYLERYPGDQYVDIVAFDTYVPGKDSVAIAQYVKGMESNLKIITDYAQKSGKLATIGETGMESVSDSKHFTETVYPMISKYKIGWVLFWRNAWEPDKPQHYYLPYEGHPAAADFKEFVEKPNILMNKDIQSR